MTSRSRIEFDDLLLRLSQDPTHGDDLRVEALDAIAARLPVLAEPHFAFLMARLAAKEPPLRRMAAARALGRSPLDDTQLMALTQAVAEAGALVLPRLLPAFERSRNPRIGAVLVSRLAEAPGFPTLTPQDLVRTVRDYSEDIRHLAEPLLRKLEVTDSEKAERLLALEPALSRGDSRRGREVFFSSRATCSACHAIDSNGGHVGPDLSRIGDVRSGRDLLEAILFPSASLARGFEPYNVATHDGHVHSGVISRETTAAIVLVTPDRNEISIPRTSIGEIEPGRVSLMPRGLDANLNHQELADLVSFLQSRNSITANGH
jgi:putative heme-binding domain-containing protein